MNIFAQLYNHACEVKLPDTFWLLQEEGKYALSFDLLGNERDKAGAEIAFLLNTGNTKLNAYLVENGLEIGLVIRKPKASHASYQAWWYAVLKINALDLLQEEILFKVRQSNDFHLQHWVPLSTDAGVCIDYMITQGRWKSIKDLETLVNNQQKKKISIRQKDIESWLCIFSKE